MILLKNMMHFYGTVWHSAAGHGQGHKQNLIATPSECF